jgi:hypothetical protein
MPSEDIRRERRVAYPPLPVLFVPFHYERAPRWASVVTVAGSSASIASSKSDSRTRATRSAVLRWCSARPVSHATPEPIEPGAGGLPFLLRDRRYREAARDTTGRTCAKRPNRNPFDCRLPPRGAIGAATADPGRCMSSVIVDIQTQFGRWSRWVQSFSKIIQVHCSLAQPQRYCLHRQAAVDGQQRDLRPLP